MKKKNLRLVGGQTGERRKIHHSKKKNLKQVDGQTGERRKIYRNKEKHLKLVGGQTGEQRKIHLNKKKSRKLVIGIRQNLGVGLLRKILHLLGASQQVPMAGILLEIILSGWKKKRPDGGCGWGSSNSGEWKSRQNRPPKQHGGPNDESTGVAFTATRKQMDLFSAEEQDVLSKIESIMQSIRRIMHQSGVTMENHFLLRIKLA